MTGKTPEIRSDKRKPREKRERKQRENERKRDKKEKKREKERKGEKKREKDVQGQLLSNSQKEKLNILAEMLKISKSWCLISSRTLSL